MTSLGPLTASEKDTIRQMRVIGQKAETIAQVLGRPVATVTRFLHSAEFLPFLADSAER